MAVFKSSSLKCLRNCSFAAGIVSLIFSLMVFMLYLIASNFTNVSKNKDVFNLHCMFMTVSSFLQIFANIFLIVGCVKKSHQYVRVWLILCIISWVFALLACVLVVYIQEIWQQIGTQYLVAIILAACFYLLNCDVIHCYYLQLHQFAYSTLTEVLQSNG
ncbi:uncharacterized protein LOC119646682 [Hermetia illucens]|uniref:uncharacterized protein LOC119646682 n=1 Tax=Hermetia illucens TaxID=343691 RepID=UPI0018CC320E|nr:uncharacterized protein LOC119646682 [Hermetia illucens]